jgi:hypothetical protein
MPVCNSSESVSNGSRAPIPQKGKTLWKGQDRRVHNSLMGSPAAGTTQIDGSIQIGFHGTTLRPESMWRWDSLRMKARSTPQGRWSRASRSMPIPRHMPIDMPIDMPTCPTPACVVCSLLDSRSHLTASRRTTPAVRRGTVLVGCLGTGQGEEAVLSEQALGCLPSTETFPDGPLGPPFGICGFGTHCCLHIINDLPDHSDAASPLSRVALASEPFLATRSLFSTPSPNCHIRLIALQPPPHSTRLFGLASHPD